MQITPDLIPHSEFHKGIWLQSIDRPSWYYFKKERNTNSISNSNFINSVDDPLKKLVKYLHSKKIKTTPSCSGHDMHERDFEKIFLNLQEDSLIIKSDGLKMKDVETNRLFLNKNKNYKLPWSKDQFLDKIISYQHKGVIGLKLGNRRAFKKQLLTLKIDGVRLQEKDSILFIFTNEEKKNDIKATWNEITKQVIDIIK